MIRSHKDHSIKKRKEMWRDRRFFIELEMKRVELEMDRGGLGIHRCWLINELLDSLPQRFTRLDSQYRHFCHVFLWSKYKIKLFDRIRRLRHGEQGKGQFWYNFDMRIFFAFLFQLYSFSFSLLLIWNSFFVAVLHREAEKLERWNFSQ